jgi:hypothetical protein
MEAGTDESKGNSSHRKGCFQMIGVEGTHVKERKGNEVGYNINERGVHEGSRT